MGDENPIRTLGDYSKPSHEGYRNTIELLIGNNMCEIDHAAAGKLRDKNADESWEIIKNLAFYDHEGWNDAKEFVKPVKAISTPHSFLRNSRPAGLLKRGEEERSDKNNVAIGDNIEKPTKIEMETPAKKAEKGNEAENKAKNEETTEVPSSQPIEYYLKHRVNENLIEGLVDNHMFNDSLSGARITRKENIGGNFEIPSNIGGLKHMNALVDQGSNVNVMPISTYMKLTNERPAGTDIRLLLASHSYICPLGIAEDILVEVAEHVYPFDKGTITLRSGKNKISFHRIPESLCKIERGVKNDIDPVAPTMIVNRLVLKWEERIKLHLEREMKFNQWKSKNLKSKHPSLVKVEGEMDDEREVTENHRSDIANGISPDPDRTWVDGILRFMRPV
ncbi:hypothetical protein Tco_0694530, partial [Tanacetum coccineum]